MSAEINEKCLLERGIPVHLINEEAKKEKIGGARSPLSNMQYYFTRKPLISSRLVVAGTILGANTIKDSNEINKLIGIDPNLSKRAYKSVPIALLRKIQESYPQNATILDPFAGSGMIPFEALRLGLDVIALDYNPVAYLLLKGTLEYPIKYGRLVDEKTGNPKLFADVQRIGNEIIQKLKNQFFALYPKHNGDEVRAYIYAWMVKCPTCGEETPLMNNWWLDKNKKIRLDYEVVNGSLVYSVIKSELELEGSTKGGNATCLYCSSKIKNNHIIKEILEKDKETLLAVSLTKGEFHLPTPEDNRAFEKSKELLHSNLKALTPFIPAEVMPDDAFAVHCKNYLMYWRRLFNPRQLLLLANLTKEIRIAVDTIAESDKDYAAAVGSYLAMMLANNINHNSRCCVWINTHNAISNSVLNRGFGMSWNHAEPNPFSKSSGSLSVALKSVLDGVFFVCEELSRNTLDQSKKSKVEVIQGSILSWKPEKKFKFIVTDPPYYNDVQYPELMEFFQVWQSRAVGHLIKIPPTASTNEELSVGGLRDDKTFETRMLVAIKNLYNLLEVDGVLSMFYAHRRVDGWKYLLEALRKTGFNVTSTIALMTENTESIKTRGQTAIFHSLLLTARKRKEEKTTTLMDLEEEIRAKVEERYPELEKISGKDRMNLLLSASGIVIETITAYSDIKSFTKNTADYALELGQRFLIESFAKRTLSSSNIDQKTMVYVWFRHSLSDTIDFSVFNQTLKALGISEDSLTDIIKKVKGKSSTCIRLLDFSERGTLEIGGMEPLVSQSIIDAVHIALRAYMRGGVTSARTSLIDSPFGSKAIFNTMTALANLYYQKNDYKEGEICKRFLEEWKNVYGGKQRTF